MREVLGHLVIYGIGGQTLVKEKELHESLERLGHKHSRVDFWPLNQPSREAALTGVTIGTDPPQRYCVKAYGPTGTSAEGRGERGFLGYRARIGYARPAYGEQDPDSGPRGLREYKLLEKLHRWSSHTPAVGVLEPLAYLPECDGFLTPRVDGVNLRQSLFRRLYYWRWRRGPITVLEDMASLGEFLAQLEEGPDQDLLSLRGLAARHQELLKDTDLPPAIRGQLSTALEMLPDLQVKAVLCHGEFAPRNVLRAPEAAPRLYVLDWDTCFYGPPCFDLHNFALNMKWWTVLPWLSRNRAKHWGEHLVKGFSEVRRVDQRVFQTTRLLHLVGYAWALQTWAQSRTGRILRQRYHRLLEEESHDVLESLGLTQYSSAGS